MAPKREAEINITGDTTDARQSIKDLERESKKSFGRMAEDAKKESDEIADAFKKTGIRMEKDIKKSSEDARRRYENIKKSGVASANDIRRAHDAMTAKIKRNNKELITSSKGVVKILDKIKRSLVLAATAGAGLFGLKSIKESIKFESALIELQKVMGDTEGQASSFTETASKLSKRFGVGADIILRGAATFRQAGFIVHDAFTLQEESLKLVKVSELEAAEATELLISLLKGFKAPASEANRFINVLNTTSNKYATNLKELSIGMAAFSPIANKMGLSAEETAGLLTPVIEVFRSGSEAAQALKTGLLKLIDDSVPVRDALSKLGVSQKELNTDMKSGKQILGDVSERFKTLDENQKLVITSQLTGILQTGKMVEVFDGMVLSAEITNNALTDTNSIAKEVAIALASTAERGNRAREAFNNLARAIGGPLKAGWNLILKIGIPTMDLMAESINTITTATRDLFSFETSIFNPFRKVKEDIDDVANAVAASIKKQKDQTEASKDATREIIPLNKGLADETKKQSLEAAQLKKAEIELLKEQKQQIEDVKDAAVESFKVRKKEQEQLNKATRKGIRETEKELGVLERRLKNAVSFVQKIKDIFASSEKAVEQSGLSAPDVIVDDLNRAAQEMKLVSGLLVTNTQASVKAAQQILTNAAQAVKTFNTANTQSGRTALQAGPQGASTAGFAAAAPLAKFLKKQVTSLSTQIQTIATQAIPPVQKKLSALQASLTTGVNTLTGINTGIKTAIANAKELKKILKEDTTATHTQVINTVNTGGNGGPGFNTGGPIPGYGGGDKVPIMAEAGEHVIKKESVRKFGRNAVAALNRGDIQGLIKALPVQHFKDGGEVKSLGSVDVNLNVGGKTFPVSASQESSNGLVKQLKSLNNIHGRAKKVY